LDAMLDVKEEPITAMLALEVPEEELVRRLLGRGASSGRTDDRDEAVIRNRIVEYEQKTAPLKEYYQKQGKYKGLDGMGTIAEITERLNKAIG
ncbi:MAG TPA: nucleoside monophosphate kinase, partial [Flavobacteriales bacterium]|nr:nucleoside monophosphate kinase [Flavobacteriales bacterium]